ncbi:MAG: hypothetical protein IT165_38030 [Bryobacterales bacterium]|nr:hypothetical protein [Bryobacterales bacterium]
MKLLRAITLALFLHAAASSPAFSRERKDKPGNGKQTTAVLGAASTPAEPRAKAVEAVEQDLKRLEQNQKALENRQSRLEEKQRKQKQNQLAGGAGKTLRPVDCDLRVMGPIYEKATEIRCAVPPGTSAADVKLLVCDSSNAVFGAITVDGTGQCVIRLDSPRLMKGDTVRIEVSGGKSAPVEVESAPAGPKSSLAQLSRGDDVVNGELKELPENHRFDLYVYSKKGALRAHSLVAVRQDKSFTAGLNYKLTCDDEVRLMIDEKSTDKYAVKCPAPEPPHFYVPREGDSFITGPAGDAQNVTAEIWQGQEGPATSARASKDSSGMLTVTFDRRLAAGDELRFKAVTEQGAGIDVAPIVAAPVAFDWGRVRAYFSMGVVLSQNDGARAGNDNYFSRQDLFVGFNIDKNWRNGSKVRVNTFLDTRLAAVPTSEKQGSGDTVTQFFTSRKAAIMQVGAYVPFTAARWRWPKDQPNVLFLAPLAKFGVVTPSSGTGNFGRFYTLQEYGLRSGHFREFEKRDPCSDSRKLDPNTAPELISYLDAVVGRFGNFRSFGAEQVPQFLRLWRASFEGVLKIPATPLVVGFNANVKLQRSKPGYMDPPDDLRFFFGTRFDVGKVLNRVLNLSF